MYVASRCRAIAAKVLSERNGDSQHVIHAMGHCHIDSGDLVYCITNIVQAQPADFSASQLCFKTLCIQTEQPARESLADEKELTYIGLMDIVSIHIHTLSAWLWPYSESIRKCARSWASVLRLMDDYPNFTFVCSQVHLHVR